MEKWVRHDESTSRPLAPRLYQSAALVERDQNKAFVIGSSFSIKQTSTDKTTNGEVKGLQNSQGPPQYNAIVTVESCILSFC